MRPPKLGLAASISVASALAGCGGEPPPPAPAPAPAVHQPPPAAPDNYWVKDPEPTPRPMPKGDLADRPWLIADAQRTGATTAGRASAGLDAFLRRIEMPAATSPGATVHAAPALPGVEDEVAR